MEEREDNYYVVIVNNGKILKALPNNWFKSGDKWEVRMYMTGMALGLYAAGRKRVTIFAIPADDFDNGVKWEVMNDNERNRKVFMAEFYWPILATYQLCSLLNEAHNEQYATLCN